MEGFEEKTKVGINKDVIVVANYDSTDIYEYSDDSPHLYRTFKSRLTLLAVYDSGYSYQMIPGIVHLENTSDFGNGSKPESREPKEYL